MPEYLRILRPVVAAQVQLPPLTILEIDGALMKPGPGQGRRREMFLGNRGEGCSTRRMEVTEDLGIELLHHAEASELTLGAVPVALVVAVLGCELALRDLIDRFHPGNHMHRERQRR